MGGFFGTISKEDCVNDLFYGTDYHFHLGTRRGGLAVLNEKQDIFTRSIHNLENSYFRPKFEDELKNFKGNSGVGVISDTDPQPIIINSHLGKFAIVTVGKIQNIDELEKKILGRNLHFAETSSGGTNPSELVSILINEEDSIESGIERAQEQIKGSCSLLILSDKGIYAARDKLGRTPIILGKKNGSFAVASESSSFPNLGFETEKYIGPGEIVLINKEGYKTLKEPGEKIQICSFLWVYYGYPASYYENVNVEHARYNCGAALAKNDEIEIDFVTGIPDSGIGHAIGYANEKKVPYMRPYVKYTPTWPRSFMPSNQDLRDLVAKMKLIPIRRLIDNKRIAFCDDSIVRGTQLQDNVQILYEYGAKETHMRIACPPLVYPCEFINFSASRSSMELASRKAIFELEKTENVDLKKYADPDTENYKCMVDCIKKRLKLTTLKYQRIDDLVDAIGLPKEKMCTHCFDGSSYF